MNKLPPIALGRLSVRPGITGLAQAEVREGSVEARLARDLWYVEHISLRTDWRILIGTLRR